MSRVESVDWRLAARVAGTVAGSGPPVSRRQRTEMSREFADLAGASDRLVREFTGLQPPTPPGEPSVLDRAGWIRVNLQGFRTLVHPLEEKIGGGSGVMRRVARSALAVQLGVLLGYLAQKVIGQYDLLLAETGERVYFVAPNVVGAERRARVSPSDFRLWVTLHEITHRTQFAAAPWLREELQRLVSRYMESVDLDGRRLRESAGRLMEALRQGPQALRRLNIVELFLTKAQRETIGRMQAVMTVVEGHGNFVMDGVGAEHIPGQPGMKAAFARQRARTGGAERLLQRALGVDMKYQQYARGEVFVGAVHDRAGMDALNRVWERPENLPTPAEISDPDAWIARTAAGAPPGET